MKTKKLISVLLVAIMVLAYAPITQSMDIDSWTITANAAETVQSGTCGDDLTWTLDTETGEFVVSGSGDMTMPIPDSSSLKWYNIRQKIKSVRFLGDITSIGHSVFLDCAEIKTVTIPEGTSLIDYQAFKNCKKLEYINIPKSITKIEYDAFFNCENLKTIFVNEENEYYSNDEFGALLNKNKTELILYPSGSTKANTYTIPETVTKIGDMAFVGNQGLSEITIGEGVVSIGYNAFSNAKNIDTIYYNAVSIEGYFHDFHNLSTLNIGANVQSIPSNLYHISGLKEIIVDEKNSYYSTDIWGVLFNKEKSTLLRFPTNSDIKNYIVPQSVTTIDSNAFAGSSNLQEITINEEITVIKANAFQYCAALHTVNYNAVNCSKAEKAFIGCGNLNTINIGINVEIIPAQIFENSDNSNIPVIPIKNVIIPSEVKSIGEKAFAGCSDLQSVTISEGLETIGNKAFENCSNIPNISLPSSLKKIDKSAFAGCVSLKKVNFKEPNANEILIEQQAFDSCYSLEDVNLPEGLTVLKDYVFNCCSSLNFITIPSTVKNINNSFFECGALETIKFKENSQLTSINLQRCYSLRNIELPPSVETVVISLTSMESFNVPKNAKEISLGIVTLKEITIDPDNQNFFLDENGALCLLKNGTVREVAVPDREDLKILKINSYSSTNLYSYLTNTEVIELAEDVTEYSVDECGVLFNKDKTTLLKYPAGNTAESYEIPATVTSINRTAFWGAENLRSFSVEEGNTHYTVVDGVLYSADKIKLVAYPIGNTSKEFEILSSVRFIESLSLLETNYIEKYSVASDNEYFFSDEDGVLYKRDKTLFLFPSGKNITEYTIADDVTVVNVDAFCGSKIENLNIPISVVQIGSSFHDSSFGIIKEYKVINYEGKSFFEDVENAVRLLAFKTVNNSVNLSSNIDDKTSGTDPATNITYSYEKDCFDYNGDIGFEVIRKTKEEYADAFRGYVDESDDIFFYDIKFYAVGESNNREVQPITGKKVKIGFPIPDGYKNANPNLFMILHKRSDNGKLEFFKPSNNNIEIKDGYIYIWANNFSPFALVINYTESNKTVSSIAIAKLPAKTSYIYRMDNLDISGLALTVTYSDGTTETVTDTSKMNVTGFDNTKVGTQTITVEYEGATAEFEINVSYAWWQWIIRILLLGFLWY